MKRRGLDMAQSSRRTRGTFARLNRWRFVGAIVSLVALGATAACGGGTDAQWQSAGSSPGSDGGGPSKPPAKVTYSVEDGATGASAASQVAVKVEDGRIDSVSLINGDGNDVPGTFDADKKTWTNPPLRYDMPYRLTVTAIGEDGKKVEGVRSFTTVKPNNYTLPIIRSNRGYGSLLDGGTFGVGQPIVIQFDEPIKDRAAAERTLTVKTVPETLGAWGWVNDDEVHWRPADYWKSGTQVTVEAKVYGVDLGNGLYGQEDRSATFKIGPKRIAIADHDSKRMNIYIDDVDVTASLGNAWDPGVPGPAYDHSEGVKVSMGAQGARQADGNWFDMRTSTGQHVVLEKVRVQHMKPALPKTDPLYYEEDVPYAVRITNSGEFVHWADWSVYQQGIYNVSHGCINLSPNDAIWFYNTFGPGDIVDVKNTGKDMDLTDGVGDWNLSFEEWKKRSALV